MSSENTEITSEVIGDREIITNAREGNVICVTGELELPNITLEEVEKWDKDILNEGTAELTVKDLRELLIGVPDDTPVSLHQDDGSQPVAYCDETKYDKEQNIFIVGTI